MVPDSQASSDGKQAIQAEVMAIHKTNASPFFIILRFIHKPLPFLPIIRHTFFPDNTVLSILYIISLTDFFIRLSISIPFAAHPFTAPIITPFIKYF